MKYSHIKTYSLAMHTNSHFTIISIWCKLCLTLAC